MRSIASLLLCAVLVAAPIVAAPLAGLAQSATDQSAASQNGGSNGAGSGSGTASMGAAAKKGESPQLKLDRWDTEASVIEKTLQKPGLSTGAIDGMRATLVAQRNAIPDIVSKANDELAPLKDQLKALGPPPKDGATEAPQVADQRKQLDAKIAKVEALIKRASQADARAAALESQLADLRRQLFTQQLLTRGPSIFEPGSLAKAWASIADVADQIQGETANRIDAITFDNRFVVRALVTLALIGAALFALLKLKRVLLTRLMPAPRPEDAGGEASGEAPGTDRAPQPCGERGTPFTGICITLVRLLLPTAALAMIAVAILNSHLLGPQGKLLLTGVARAVLAVIVAYALGGAYYSPRHPEFRLSGLPDGDAVGASRWLMALAAVIGLNLLFVEQGHELGLSIEGLEFLNTILVCCGGVVLWRFAHFIRTTDHAPRATEQSEDGDSDEKSDFQLAPALAASARFAARTVAVVSPALALMGYFAASRFLFYPVVLSGAVIGACLLLFARVQDVVDRVSGADRSQPEGAEHPSRAQLIPVIVGFLLVCAATPVLALVWGADFTDLSGAWRMMVEGFQVGNVTVSPVDFFWFLLVFSIGYMLTRILQGILSRSVLPVTGLDSGGRAAVRAGVGYVGIVLSALVAISATGLDLSNLAIVAGALSVGIGFGLQNIVNNFVSGIILLIERPIKAGDWVELGSGMGYVKRINVRSTEIQTFDRASLIVPNSELISGPVTNWTHTDLNGRIIVPVGVAYGTDPRKVETILTEIAKAQTMLLRRPAPYVLFRRFGADALEFEIRGVLRDVNWILNVQSDINFEIARRFAEAGIEIPFAQRDLHLRNADELGQSIAGALRSARDETPDGDEEADEAASSDADPGPSGDGAPAPRRRRRPRQPPARGDGDPPGDADT